MRVAAMGILLLLLLRHRGQMLHELQLSSFGTTDRTASRGVGKGAWGHGRVHCSAAFRAKGSAVAGVFWGSAVDDMRVVLLRGLMDGRKGSFLRFWRRGDLL